MILNIHIFLTSECLCLVHLQDRIGDATADATDPPLASEEDLADEVSLACLSQSRFLRCPTEYTKLITAIRKWLITV